MQLLRELNRSGRRKLPDIVPMPFTNRQWSTVVLKDGKPDRRAYQTAVVATLRDRLRAGVWVEGSRDYRRFDAYRQQNRLHLALGEIGRIERSLFMLDWIESPQLRMECQAASTRARRATPWRTPCSPTPKAASVTARTTPSKSESWP